MIICIIFLCITILFISIMVIWSVTSTNPNSGTVQDLGNGQFNFPTNSTSDNITYNVNYTDDNGCTAQTTYTVPFCPVPSCSCDSFDVTRSITMPASGDTTGAIGNWTDGCPPTVNSKPDWVTVDINDRHYIAVIADENTSSDERNGVITFSYNGEICDKKIDVTQEGNSQCNCSYFDVSSGETFPASGGSIGTIGNWTDACPPTVNSKPDWVTVNINDDHSIMASADENTSSSQRNGVVTFSYNGEICDKKMNVTQYGKSNCEMRNRVTVISVSGLEKLKSDMPFSVDSNGGSFYVEYFDNTNCDGVVTETYNSEFDFTTTSSSDYNVNINVGGSWLGQYSVHGSIEYESTPRSLFMDNSKTLEINGFNYPNAIKMYYGEILYPTYKHELYLYCVDSTHDGDTFEVVYEASNGVSCTIYISFSPTSIFHTFDFYNLDILDY